jgi:hypothetical protein
VNPADALECAPAYSPRSTSMVAATSLGTIPTNEDRPGRKQVLLVKRRAFGMPLG